MAKKKKRRSKSRSNSIDEVIASASAAINNNSNGKENNNLPPSPKHRPKTAPADNAAAAFKKLDEEDLSSQRHDEETVLSAIYGNDFTLESGAWNCPLYKLRIRPASDVTDHGGHINTSDSADVPYNPNKNANENDPQSCEVTLHIQLNQKYPYSVPLIQITNVKGCISNNQISELLSLLQSKAKECVELGQVMGWEMGQVVEGYLMDCVEKRKKDDLRRLEDMQMKNKKKKKGEESHHHVDFDDEYALGDGDNTADVVALSANATEFNMMDSDTQKEIERQMQALDNAAQLRKQRRQRARAGILPSIVDKQNGDDDDDDDEEDDEDDNFLQLPEGYDDLAPAAFVTTDNNDAKEQQQSGGSNSRYQTDFVEIAHLGRGGGGEVVQAINRLDRRVYAIKKVLLEGATTQNEKLRREVTTISMMSHKNIVRYYQAWVEKGDQGEDDDNKPNDVKEDEELTSGESGIIKNKNDDESKDDDDASSSSSWDNWSSSGSSSSSDSPSSDNGMHDDSKPSIAERSVSLDNFLEHELETPNFGNPLFGNGTLGYPPIAATSSKATSLLPSHNEQLYSTSDWQASDLNSEQRKRQQSNGIMYIQMQYCKTTIRDMIDDSQLSYDIVWKSLRQILEALVYIHSRNVIHRDLKPANIFIDDEENIRLGDFGLATSNSTTKPQGADAQSTAESEADALYEAIDDISGLLGASSSANARSSNQASMNSITGGVGTTFYMAPEQEHSRFSKTKSSYGSKADIYSLGILLFEMFMLKPIGCTYMERAELLTALRGDPRGVMNEETTKGSLFTETGELIGDWEHSSAQRFPAPFRNAVPLNAQKIILWCLERSPKNRPSAKQLLACDLMPRKIQLEKKYLNEVLETLNNPQSDESYQQILSKLFDRPTPSSVLITYDYEISLKANKIDTQQLLAQSLNAVKGSHWARLSYSNPMSAVSAAAAVSALGRAQHVGTVTGGGKEGEVLRGAPQQTATILAMSAATSAAIEGQSTGQLGADPRVVEMLCRQLTDIFQSHGAVRLQGPLLRPRESIESESVALLPVEMLARRGSVLRLREDLCVTFARAVSRGGSATSNMKRYDINKVYNESDAGLHPKEMLEASFDIIQDENTAKPEFLEAESILVLCRAMALLKPKEDMILEFPPVTLRSPVWYLRLTHTRLSDAIMDMMFLPTSGAIRQCCLNLLSTLTACPATELCNQRRQSGKHKRKARADIKAQKMDLIDKTLEASVANDSLPKRSAKRLRAFLSHFVVLHLDANRVLDIIYEGTKKIYHADINSSNHSDEVKRLSKNCFSEVIRCINRLRSLLKAMEALGIITATANLNKKEQHPRMQSHKNISYPAYISIDLGLRQKRNNFYGSTFFQAVLLRNNFGDSETAKTTTLGSKGIRVAEGGRYDDLVRQFRPPGNFGSIQVNDYTSATFPYCTGLIFFIGKMIERIYSDASKDDTWQGHSYVESLRRSIGHPLIDSSVSIQCIVTSENGLDLATCAERASIASHLWTAGIKCEYLAQSGALLSLLRHLRSSSAVHEWSSSVDRICGISAMLNIPFVVVVQPHLLKSKAAVKLRQITTNTPSGPVYDGSEELVNLESLPSLLLDRLSSQNDTRDDLADDHQASNEDASNQVQPHGNIDMECIYVGTDQYFDNEHRVNNTQWKQIKKIMAASQKKMASHINKVVDIPVIAIDLPFRVVRDLGTSLIFDGIESLNSNGAIAAKYPQHKKLLRNLMYALDALVRKDQSQRSSVDNERKMKLFLYSISCDECDLISLTLPPA